ncbi:hypothetical protein [Slackia equolifaciens]|uniref:hypothetical protein n=1 Tax=Slackia equolifaciens TaxID=498718 RepID=UPI0011CD78E6|nr:hypothetical protein [Slackia equolifaciens]
MTPAKPDRSAAAAEESDLDSSREKLTARQQSRKTHRSMAVEESRLLGSSRGRNPPLDGGYRKRPSSPLTKLQPHPNEGNISHALNLGTFAE